MVTKNYQHINLTYLDLMTDGDPETRNTLLDLLVEELQTVPAQLREACERSEWVAALGIAHKMKSSLAFVGNDELIRSNQALWQGLHEKRDPAGLAVHLDALERLSPLAEAELLKEKKSQ